MAVGLLILAAASVEGESARSDARAPGTAITNPITDLVLIYDGSPRRGVWSPERFKPYVLREKEGEVEWLFDGFLFIEFLAKSGARLCPITNRKDADKRDWQDLIDHYFQAGQSIPALEQLMASLAAKGNQPARKRKVVITPLTPITGSSPDRIDIYQIGANWVEESWISITRRTGLAPPPGTSTRFSSGGRRASSSTWNWRVFIGCSSAPGKCIIRRSWAGICGRKAPGCIGFPPGRRVARTGVNMVLILCTSNPTIFSIGSLRRRIVSTPPASLRRTAAPAWKWSLIRTCSPNLPSEVFR